MPCVVLCVALGCSSEPPEPNECPAPRAAFALSLSAQDGELPSDTQLDVTFSAGREVFALAEPGQALEAVRCETVVEAERVVALSCALWTDGPADVAVTATGFNSLRQSLAHEVDDCGVRTVDVELELEPKPESP